MPNVVGQMADIYQTQLAASRRVADVVLTGTGEIDRLMIDAARRAVTTQLQRLQSTVASGEMPSPSDTNVYEGVQTNAAIPTEIVRIVSEMQTEIGKTLQACMQQVSSEIAHHVALQSETARSSSSNAFGPVGDIFSTWQKMMDRPVPEVPRTSTEEAAGETTVDVTNSVVEAEGGIDHAPEEENETSTAFSETQRSPVMHSVKNQGEKRPTGSQRRK